MPRESVGFSAWRCVKLGDCWRNLAFKQSCRDRRYLIPADPTGFMSGYELKLHV